MSNTANPKDDTNGDRVVGHKTMRRPDGSRYHVPMTQSEVDALWAKLEAEEAKEKEGRTDGAD